MINFERQPMVENIYCNCGNHDVIGRLSADAEDYLKMAWMEDMYTCYTKDEYCETDMTNDDFEEGLHGHYAEIVESYGATCDPACKEYE